MEAKDTVIRVKCHCEQLYKECNCSCNDCNYAKTVNEASEAQAEISFKAGYREAQDGVWDKVMGAKKSGFDEGKKAGIREVVEWLSNHSHCGTAGGASFCIANWEWQAKLKEWGIDNE